MEFGIKKMVLKKCAMLIMKNRKRESMERTKLPHRKSIRTHEEKENYKSQGILKADTIKQTDMKEKVRKENSEE